MSELKHFGDIDSFVWYENKISVKKDFVRFNVSFILSLCMAMIVTRVIAVGFKPVPAMILVTTIFLIIFTLYILYFIYIMINLKVWFAFNKDELLIKHKSNLVERMNWIDLLRFESDGDEIDVISPMPNSRRFVLKADEELISKIKDMYNQSLKMRIVKWKFGQLSV